AEARRGARPATAGHPGTRQRRAADPQPSGAGQPAAVGAHPPAAHQGAHGGRD
nr:hypothetical protein [Tanacetum cinerariifolium]